MNRSRWSGRTAGDTGRIAWPLWFRDLRHTVRHARSPAAVCTMTAIATLALGTGANLTIFSFVNTFLHRARFSVPQPHGTGARVWRRRRERTGTSSPIPNYLDARAAAQRASISAAHAVTSDAQSAAGESRRGAHGRARDRQLFPGAGSRPGRRALARRARRRRVRARSRWRCSSHGFWRYAVRGPVLPAVGQTLRGERRAHSTIVGVGAGGVIAAPSVRTRSTCGSPLTMHESVRPSGRSLSRRGWGWLSMIGRLQSARPTWRALRHELESRRRRGPAALSRPRSPSKFGFAITPASGVPTKPTGTVMAPDPRHCLTRFTVLLMIVTCANLAGVMQARLAARRPRDGYPAIARRGPWPPGHRMDDRVSLPRRRGRPGRAHAVARLIGVRRSRVFRCRSSSWAIRRSRRRSTGGWRDVRASGSRSSLASSSASRPHGARAGVQAFELLKDESGTVTSGRRGARAFDGSASSCRSPCRSCS